MQSVKGKKLLVLAGSVHLADLIKRAKELGIYTIVTDYNDQYDSPAKRTADEVWNISWADIDKLEEACRKAKVDGVVAGYSEFTVENQIKLCNKLGLPCYCTEKQLDVTRNKDFFKRVCIANGVPVIHEYDSVEDVTSFPVIVKPVDRGGSIGISVANNHEELLRAEEYALEMSVSKRIIIEDFISEGTKIDLYYGIIDGKITLMGTSDTITAVGNASENGFDKVVQNGWVCPSRYQKEIVDQVDVPLKRMIKSLGIKYGFIFFSGFAIEDGSTINFAMFETGFRLSGGHMFKFFENTGFIDVQDIFIYHALLGDNYKGHIGSNEHADLKAVVVNYYAKEGTLAAIEGVDLIGNMNDCQFIMTFGRVGHLCSTENAILYKLAMFHFYNQSPEGLANDVSYANRAFAAIDEYGHDMVFERLDTDILRNWWERPSIIACER